MHHLAHDERVALLDPTADISLARQAKLFDISRSSIYYKKSLNLADIVAMHAIDQEFTDHPFYGSRRMKVSLKRDHQISMCREHVIRLMHLMGLEALYPKQNTSKPDHLHRVYPYLLAKLTAEYPNHIWGTDITYIRLKEGFCYMVAVIDWYSRYIVHWELSPTLEIPFCIDNITRALTIGTPDIHNSDQGSHFTSPQYIEVLTGVTDKTIAISMDGRGRCMDNIFTERLWRSLKYECVYLNEFTTFIDAKIAITKYFTFYNNSRPHQSLNYETPESVYFGKTLQKIVPLSLSNLSTFTV